MSLNGTLRYSMRSAAVKTLQTQLKKVGHFNGPVTGYYGPITRGAVSAFERAEGLRRDGVADPVMRLRLQSEAKSQAAGQPLRTGMSNPQVLALQQQLKKLGHFTVRPTGYFGPITQRAVRQFEKAHGLNVDGVAGRQVQELAAKLAKAVKPPVSAPASWKTAPAPPHDYRRVTSHGVTMNVRTRVMLERAEKYARALGAPGSFSLSQGSYHRGVSASAGTHDGGGVLDIRVSSYSAATADRMVKALRMAGFAAWRRGVGDGLAPHIHAVAIGDRQATAVARNQVPEYFRGGDGLVGSRRDIHLGSVGHNIGRPVPQWASRYA